jgi:hypothetical protein
MDKKSKEDQTDPDEKPEEIKEEKKDEGPPVVIDTRLLKTGDYELHVFLEETRGLVHPTDTSYQNSFKFSSKFYLGVLLTLW